MSRRASDWSQLPVELLEKIAGSVDEIADRVRFGAACRPWRSASRSPRLPLVRLPWLLILDIGCSRQRNLEEGKDDGARSCLCLSDRKVYTLKVPRTRHKRYFGSAHGWLLALNDSNKKRTQFMLVNPITGVWFSLPLFPQYDYAIDHCKLFKSNDALVVVVAYSFGACISFFQIREAADFTSAAWTEIRFDDPRVRDWPCVSDFTYHCGFYFALGENDFRTLVIDPDARKVVAVVPSILTGCLPDSYSTGHNGYLAESSPGDDLFLVISPSRNKESRFEVFKLDRAEQNLNKWSWSKVRSIGCNVVFLDGKNAMVLPASGFDGLRPNCIVFCGYDYRIDCHAGCSSKKKPDYIGLFDLENDRVNRLARFWDKKFVVSSNYGWFIPSLDKKKLILR